MPRHADVAKVASRMIRSLVPFLMAGPALAQEPPPALLAEIANARTACAEFESGEAVIEDGALSRHDFTGDGTADDWAFDLAHVSCSSAASMYCGTGGCGLYLAVGDHLAERLARSWTVVAFGRTPVVLLDVHGALCGGINPTPCAEALAWDSDAAQFRSVAQPTE